MAINKGIGYFSMNTTFDTSVRLLISRYKNSGLGIWIRVLQALYREGGYYMVWDEESAMLLSDELSEDAGLLCQIIAFCIDKGIFDNNLYEKYSILTSRRIQENFYNAVKRKKDVDVRADFVIFEPLLSFCIHDVNKNNKNANTMYTENEKMYTESDKLNETKLNKNKDIYMHDKHAQNDFCDDADSNDNNNADSNPAAVNKTAKKSNAKNTYSEKFERFYEMYPNAKEKSRTYTNWKKVVKDYKEDDLVNAAVNYTKEMKILKRDKQYMKTSANFLGKDSIFEDFLDGNYKASSAASATKSKNNSFVNFEQQYSKMSEEELEKIARMNVAELDL